MDSIIFEKGKSGDTTYDVFSKFAGNRTIFLYEEIDSEIATKIAALLLYFDTQSKTKEIKFYINSPGGSVSGYLAIYDVMSLIRAPIRTICIGQAASGAADLLSSGSPGKREATANAEIMIHSIRGKLEELSGNPDELTRDVKLIKKLNERCAEILAQNTGHSLVKILKDCKTDKYFTAQEALDYGIIDKVLKSVKKR